MMQQRSRPIDVIAMYGADGNIRPLRLRIEDENRQAFRINIDDVIKTTDIPYVGAEATVFLCRATVGSRSRIFELKYQFRSHSWYLLE